MTAPSRRPALIHLLSLVLLACLVAPLRDGHALPVDTDGYRVPPQAVIDLVDMAPPEFASPSPDGSLLLIGERPPLPALADLAAPELRLAGVRFNPDNAGPSVPAYAVRLRLQPVDGEARPITGLPVPLRALEMSWSPDGRHIALLQVEADALRLWRIDVAQGRAQKWSELRVHAAWGQMTGSLMQWTPDSRAVHLLAVPAGRGDPPGRAVVPMAPVVTESRGRVAPTRTYQDLLRDRHDERLFEHHFTTQLTRVELSGRVTALGEPAIFTALSSSPDGRHLLVQRAVPPWSYAVPVGLFAREVDVWSSDARRRLRIADTALADELSTSFDAVVPGRRSVAWRPDADAILTWVEAGDGGDPARAAEVRDRLFQLPAPFTGTPELLLESPLRIVWRAHGDGATALVWERWWRDRSERVSRVAPDGGQSPALLWARSYEDRYADPGFPMLRRDHRGQARIVIQDGAVYLSGQGASPEGNRPFVDRLDLADGSSQRLWQSTAPHFEQPLALLDPDRGLLLTQREAVDDPPEFHLRTLGGDSRPITRTEHPLPGLKGIHRELITYPREDGVTLSATLLLPAGYDPARDGPLPTVVWAYPREFLSAEAAGQLADSPYRFNRISYWSAQFLAVLGYAVLDNATMPVVASDGAEPNDRFIEQIGMNARAAIDAGVARGVTDPARVAVGGHSYGAFMTTSLLAHTDLFRTGIARSGAYNRSLTPFGFQSEQRTLWDDPDLYTRLSPFFHAHRIEAPLLIIHGSEDNNAGTFPMQSERLYQAIKGLGGSARLVMLPLESHGYRARESVLHMLHETVEWLAEHLAPEVSGEG